GVDSLGMTELVLLASLQACPADLLDLMPEQVRPPGKLSFVTPQVGQLPTQTSQACPQGAGVTAEVGEACPAVEELDVLGAPERIIPVSARPPTSRPTASITIDLPAPVSPVRAFRPGPKAMRAWSITARFEISSSMSTAGSVARGGDPRSWWKSVEHVPAAKW